MKNPYIKRSLILRLSFLICFYSLIVQLSAQWGAGIYGNEWIEHSQEYFKLSVKEDGWYKVSISELSESGFQLEGKEASKVQLFNYGNEIPVKISTNGVLTNQDVIEFYGQKNGGDKDRSLYIQPDKQHLNPHYSLFTDENPYFLTIGNADGKRVTEMQEPANAQEVTHYWREILFVYNNDFIHFGSQGRTNSDYNDVEGFALTMNSNALEITQDFEISNIADVEKPLRMEFNLTGELNSGIKNAVFLNNEMLDSVSYVLQNVVSKSYEIDKNLVNSSTNTVAFRAKNSQNVTSLSYLKIEYATDASIVLDHLKTISVESDGTARRLNLGVTAIDENLVFYDPISGKTLPVRSENTGEPSIIFPASTSFSKAIIINTQNSTSPNLIGTVNFSNFQNLNKEYIIISHQKFINKSEGESSVVSEYVDYRSSGLGGSFDVEVFDIQNLYDQFAYGVNSHPYSVKNFVNFIHDNWEDPQHLLIIGKGLLYPNLRNILDAELASAERMLVPSFGSPGADNLLASRFGDYQPLIPIGRIPATSDDQVRGYLNKVKIREQYLSSPIPYDDLAWNKEIVYLVGGIPSDNQHIRRNALKISDEASKSDIPPKEEFYFKLTTDIIANTSLEDIYADINNGCSFVQFFGHSGTTVFDINITEYERYDNYAKWPILVGLGCNAGNLYQGRVNVGEELLFLEDQGYVGFISSSGYAFANSLSRWGEEFYPLVFSNENVSIGEANRIAVREGWSRDDIQSQQMNLFGDPALTIYQFKNPDLYVPESSVELSPKFPDISQESFDLKYKINNLGQNVDKVKVLIVLSSADIIDTIFNDEVELNLYENEQLLTIPVSDNYQIGEYLLNIQLDPLNDIDEEPKPLAESNNGIVDVDFNLKAFKLQFVSSGIVPIYPQNFAITNKAEILAYSKSPLESNGKLILEIDTVDKFYSPAFMTFEQTDEGSGFISFDLEGQLIPGHVYYWRTVNIIKDSLSVETPVQSFLYDKSLPEGWNLSHDFQNNHENFEVYRIYYDTLSHSYEAYTDDVLYHLFENRMYSDSLGTRPAVYQDLRPNRDYLRLQRFPVIAFHYVFSNHRFRNHRNLTDPGIDYKNTANQIAFRTDTKEQRQEIIDFLKNVPKGSYLYINTVFSDLNYQRYNIEDWESDGDENLFTAFRDYLGVTEFAKLKERGVVPYSAFVRKGLYIEFEQAAEDIYGEVISPEIKYFINRENYSNLTSKLIGPAKSWGSIDISVSEYAFRHAESENTQFYYDIIGIEANGSQTSLIRDTTVLQLDISNISAEKYPYLKINMEFFDEHAYLPQLNHARIYFEGLPDLTFDPKFELSNFDANELDFSKAQSFKVGVKNLSNYEIDSSHYSINIVSNDIDFETQTGKIPALKARESTSIAFDLNLPLEFESGSLVINLNPDKDPNEQTFNNNMLTYGIGAIRDRIPPNIEMYANGRPVLNNEILPVNTRLEVVIGDYYPRILDNPENVSVILKSPSSQVNLSHDPTMLFTKGTEENNIAKFSWDLIFQESGDYVLQVQAKDESGNKVRESMLEYNFKVEIENTLSNVYNYPNPFKDKTRFYYQLTGSVPDVFTIRIFTANGRVVKEITKQELGNIQIGAHFTDYEWDGRDNFGNKLAPGVYLYKVITRDASNAAFKKNSGDISNTFFSEDLNNDFEFFKNGYGKLVILN